MGQKKAEQAAEEHVKVVSAAQSVVADTQTKVEEAVKKEEAEADKTVKSKMDEVKEKVKEVAAAKEVEKAAVKTEQKAKVKAEVKEKVAKATMTNAEKYSLLKGKVVEAKKMVDTIIADQSKIESSVGAAAASAKAATSTPAH